MNLFNKNCTMRKTHLATLLALLLTGSSLTAQTVTDVDRTKYPDYSERFNPDYSLVAPARDASAPSRSRAVSGRPDHVNNAETRHFPPVFNQDGGSCGSASRISYMFSYELAAYRDLDGSKAENYYPSHFVWLHTNSPTGITDQGKDAFVTKVGVPSAATYGGQTYSSLFGNQDCSNDDFGWMQGYDKWFEAMHNRMLKPVHFPQSIATEEGREAVKNWLWNHNGDDSFAAGGICGVGVASGGIWKNIPKTATNDEIGVTGMYYVYEWGTQVDHALTIVGYDDRIEFDLDKDGVYGEPDADELGAWIIVNSWGGWCNGGFIYCPYAFAGSAFKNDGNPGSRTFNGDFWWPEIYKVRKDYRPLRTIKLEMDYNRRSEIALSAGISADINASEPEKTIPFVHFTYAGDGNYGNSNPAPEVPMLGRWADGKLHTEPMEFGYDLTDLTDGYDMNRPLKYFFIVDTRAWAQGKGTIHHASIMDYQYDQEGIETPFFTDESVEIRSAGNKTIISVVVYGSSYHAPQNASFDGNTLSWQAPLRSALEVIAYNIYRNGMLVAHLPATTLTYTPTTTLTSGEYAVTAIYAGDNESAMSTAKVPMSLSAPNMGVNFSQGGFTIPNVFASKYPQATIEYWIKPTSLIDWNQSGGPGWGNFMFHANASGLFTAGWDTSNRLNTSASLKVGKWNHVAIVVNNNKMTVYLDGISRGSVTSSSYSGLGGFGDLVFSASGNGAQNAQYDDIRIWNTARTAEEVKAYKDVEFTGSVAPHGLIAYLKGDLMNDNSGTQLLYDCIGGHHATLSGTYTAIAGDMPQLGMATEAPTVSINIPQGAIYAGIPVTLTATCNAATNQLEWTAEGAGISALSVSSPTVTFATAGTHTVMVTATSANGATATATCDITVEPSPVIDATFTKTASNIPAGERVTFLANTPLMGYIYEWSMPGADIESAASVNAAASYQAKGTYTVTLTVTAPDGSQKSHSEQIEVQEVAPVAAFSISPAIVIKGEEVTLTDDSQYAPNRWVWQISSTNANYVAYDQHRSLTIDKPGVYDVSLSASNDAGTSKASRERALIVVNADSKNGLLFSSDAATVTANAAPLTNGQTECTIEWWMNSGWPVSYCNGIGDTEQTLLLKSNAGKQMLFFVGGKKVISSADFLIPGEWHHYAVTYSKGAVKFYRDGYLQTSSSTSITKLPAQGAFRLGGSEVPFKGSIDELRVWGKALTESQLRTYANAPIEDVAAAETTDKLALYYNFNQSGGNVQDATSNANHGARTGFGPDGDAWGLSKGVFCLNFDKSVSTDVTATYLINYAKPFASTATCINPNLSSRAFALQGWTSENAHVNSTIVTGAHVDKGKNTCFTVTTGWDGFSTLTDHKVFQTVTLPAGSYAFEAQYDNQYEGQCGSSYIVVAAASTLPTTDNLGQALAYTAMKAKGQAASNKAEFVLTEETTVSLGLLVNMNGMNCMTLQRFTLMRSEVEILPQASDVITSPDKLNNEHLYHISLPYHTAGLAAWAVAEGGDRLTSTQLLGIEVAKDNTAQQFAFVSNDDGATRYLYHAATKKFINKDGSLSDIPADALHFKAGAYDTTFVAYFDDAHYIAMDANRQLVITAQGTPDAGNSCAIYPAGKFNPREVLAKLPAVPVTEITLSHSEATLQAGNSLTLTAHVVPHYATDKTVIWTTSDANVAIVVKGVVTAIAPGTATITARADDKEATCVITVEQRTIPVSGIYLNQSKATVTEGETLTLTATVTPADATDKAIVWTTSDPSVATVADGVVTAIAPGTATITARAGSKEATCIITVEERYIPLTAIVLSQTEATIEVGDLLTITATLLPENTSEKTVSWSTSDRKIATVRRGIIEGKAPGTAIITASNGDIEATCVITVTPADGIGQVSQNAAKVDIYDVTGRPIRLGATSTSGLQRGIYIINGRKVVIK